MAIDRGRASAVGDNSKLSKNIIKTTDILWAIYTPIVSGTWSGHQHVDYRTTTDQTAVGVWYVDQTNIEGTENGFKNKLANLAANIW